MLCLLKALQPFKQQAALPQNQMFELMSLWGTFYTWTTGAVLEFCVITKENYVQTQLWLCVCSDLLQNPVCFFWPVCFGYVYVGAHMPWCMCRGQRAIWGSEFSPPTMWTSETQFRSSSLAASSFTHWATSPDSLLHILFEGYIM